MSKMMVTPHGAHRVSPEMSTMRGQDAHNGTTYTDTGSNKGSTEPGEDADKGTTWTGSNAGSTAGTSNLLDDMARAASLYKERAFAALRETKKIPLDPSLPPQGLLNKLRAGYACFYPELPWGAPPSWKESGHTTTSWLVTWEFITGCACFWVAFSLPYSFCIDGVKLKEHQIFVGCAIERWGELPPTPSSVYAGLDLLCDTMFLVDMIINFFTAQWVITTRGREEWQLAARLSTVRVIYMWTTDRRSWIPVPQFWVDILGVIPWQYTECLGEDQSIVFLRFFRLFKLLRLKRLVHLLEAIRFAYPDSRFAISALQLFVVIICTAHWMACCWFYIGYEPNGWVLRQHLAEIEHVGDDVVKIIPIYKYDPTYRVPGGDRGDGNPSEFWSNPLVYEWISSFYWAITTMTTIGYGDISAVSSRERAFSCAVEIMGCCFFAWSTGLITSLLSDTPYCVDRFKSTMDELDEFTSSRGLNNELVQKMKSFYMLKFPTMRIYDEHAVIDGLPKGLARAVKMELFQDVLSHCPLFFGMNVGLTVRNSDGKQTLSLEDVGVSVAGDVCTRLQTLYKTEGLELTAEGDLPDALYICRSGKLNVSTRGHDLFVAQSGDILGEMALLGFSKDGRRLRTSKCLTMCELCYITKESLEELLLVGGFQVPLRRMLACYVEGLACKIHRDDHDVSVQSSYKISKRAKSCEIEQMEKEEDAFDFDHIPWRLITARLRALDEHVRSVTKGKTDDDDAQGTTMRKNMTNILEKEAKNTPDQNGAKRSYEFSNSLIRSATKAIRLKHIQKSSKLLRTDLAIFLRQMKLPKEDVFCGGAATKRICLAASWKGMVITAEGTLSLDSTRGFTCPFMISVKNGVAKFREGIMLKLKLMCGEFCAWKDMEDIHFFVYLVTGAFSPPLPEDSFSRLDDTGADTLQMESEEALLGLKLLHTGVVPIAHAIANRQGAGSESDDEVKGFSGSVAAFIIGEHTHCALTPYGSSKVHDEIEIILSTEAVRVLSPESVWHRAIGLLRKRSDNQFWYSTNMRRVQWLRRRVLFERFKISENGEKWGDKHKPIDEVAILGMRVGQLEQKLEKLSTLSEKKFYGLDSKMTTINAQLRVMTDLLQGIAVGVGTSAESPLTSVAYAHSHSLPASLSFKRDNAVPLPAIPNAVVNYRPSIRKGGTSPCAHKQPPDPSPSRLDDESLDFLKESKDSSSSSRDADGKRGEGDGGQGGGNGHHALAAYSPRGAMQTVLEIPLDEQILREFVDTDK